MIVTDFFNEIISTDVNIMIQIDFFKFNMVVS